MPGLTDLLDSDMESNTNYLDENSLISSVSDTTSVAQTKNGAAKKPRKRKCVTLGKKPRATKNTVKTEGTESEPAPNPRSTAGTKRKAIAQFVEEDDIVETEAPETKAKSTKAAQPKEPARASKLKASKKPAVEAEDQEVEDSVPSPVAMRSNFANVKSTKPLPRPVPASKAKPLARKTQKVVARQVEDVVSEEDMDEEQDMVEELPPRKRARTESRVRQEPSYRRRAGSVSDTERGDPMLRRKLGDITRKYENMDMKYRNLKDVAISEANANAEKLRKQCETITEASNKLVTSLKKELAMQAPAVQESRKYKKEAQNHEAEAKRLRTINNDLTTNLAAAQNEIKSLQAKLAAARSTPAPPETKAVPSSSLKPAVQARVVAPASNESTQVAQLKLDLYSDLTGLIVRGVKQTEDGDTYDCIQTGRNGALHFKLFIDTEDAKKVGFEETEFLYTPLLDANRDAALISMMPEYLTEDITFVRENAAKFYARVVDTLTKRIEAE